MSFRGKIWKNKSYENFDRIIRDRSGCDRNSPCCCTTSTFVQIWRVSSRLREEGQIKKKNMRIVYLSTNICFYKGTDENGFSSINRLFQRFRFWRNVFKREKSGCRCVNVCLSYNANITKARSYFTNILQKSEMFKRDNTLNFYLRL